MAYRDDRKCHICGAETRLTCPGCQEAVCEAHTLAGQMDDASEQQRAAAERLARRLGSADMCEACMASEAAASGGRFVEVVRLTDPVTAEMVCQALLGAGYDARAMGGTSNAALLGAGQSIFEQRIEVPEGQAERAEELARGLLDAELPAVEEDAPDDKEDGSPTGDTARRPGGLVVGLLLVALAAAAAAALLAGAVN